MSLLGKRSSHTHTSGSQQWWCYSYRLLHLPHTVLHNRATDYIYFSVIMPHRSFLRCFWISSLTDFPRTDSVPLNAWMLLWIPSCKASLHTTADSQKEKTTLKSLPIACTHTEQNKHTSEWGDRKDKGNVYHVKNTYSWGKLRDTDSPCLFEKQPGEEVQGLAAQS